MLLYTFYPTIEKCYKNVMCLLVHTVSIPQWTLQRSVGVCKGTCVLYGAPILWGHLVRQKGSLGEKFIYTKKWVFRFPFFKVFTIKLDGNSKKSYFLNKFVILIKNFNLIGA